MNNQVRDYVRRGQQREVVQRVVPGGAAGHQTLRPRQAQVRHHRSQKGGRRNQLNLNHIRGNT